MAKSSPTKPDATFFTRHRRWFIGGGIVLLCLAVGLVVGLKMAEPQLTAYIEGDSFREELNKQTSKGLNFKGEYGKIVRTGFDTAWADSFQASDGVKAMKSLKATDISAKFNPGGFFRRWWELDYIHIKRGEVEVQTYEPQPEEKPDRPWYAIFMPYRVQLNGVVCDWADVKWRMSGKEAGIYGTTVNILPYGTDFEYMAYGGKLNTHGLAPTLDLRSLHLIITKTFLRVVDFVVVPEGQEKASIRLTGEMGMRDNKHVDFTLEVDDVAIAPWLPSEVSADVAGRATGHVRWIADEQTIEASGGDGELTVSGGKLANLPMLGFLASAAANASLKTISLKECRVTFQWTYPRFEISDLDIVAVEKVALKGSVVLDKGQLSGTLQLGLDPEYLKWLPKAEDEIFTKREKGMIWTTVRLSGTLAQPKDDLTPRLTAALKKDPAAAAGLLLREAGEWIKQKIKRD